MYKRTINKTSGFYETVRQEMRLRNYSSKTIKSYLSCLRLLVKYIQPQHPRNINNEDIRNFLLYLIEEKNFASSSVNQVFNALRCNALPKSRQKLYKKSRDIFKLPFLELVV
jgi:site-specific recombinase XerD